MTNFQCRNRRFSFEAGCRANILHCNDFGDKYIAIYLRKKIMTNSGKDLRLSSRKTDQELF